jgi:hypothetical protein
MSNECFPRCHVEGVRGATDGIRLSQRRIS